MVEAVEDDYGGVGRDGTRRRRDSELVSPSTFGLSLSVLFSEQRERDWLVGKAPRGFFLFRIANKSISTCGPGCLMVTIKR